jgi:hypothetical protein
MLRRVALVRIDVSEELSSSFIRVTIGVLGTTLVVGQERDSLSLVRLIEEKLEVAAWVKKT